jgi:hypothetical protein
MVEESAIRVMPEKLPGESAFLGGYCGIETWLFVKAGLSNKSKSHQARAK